MSIFKATKVRGGRPSFRAGAKGFRGHENRDGRGCRVIARAAPSERTRPLLGPGTAHRLCANRSFPTRAPGLGTRTTRTTRTRAFPLTEWIGAQVLAGPPWYYFVYLLLAGFGVPLSEDALVTWIGAKLAVGSFATLQNKAAVLAWVFSGVVLSDMVTFSIGVLAQKGLLARFFPNWKESETGKSAKQEVERWGSRIGFMQRFFIGFRAPLCLCSGIIGAKPSRFFLGACLGALFTVSIQMSLGFFLLRHAKPNAYVATLALVAVPTLVGNVIGPLSVTVSGLLLRYRKKESSTDVEA